MPKKEQNNTTMKHLTNKIWKSIAIAAEQRGTIYGVIYAHNV